VLKVLDDSPDAKEFWKLAKLDDFDRLAGVLVCSQKVLEKRK
jgi:hypothetical protein